LTSCASSGSTWQALHLQDFRSPGKTDINAGSWSESDGVIHSSGKGDDLLSRKNYADFALELEWSISPKGNSGIFFRGIEQAGKPYYESAIEMQVLDNSSFPPNKQANNPHVAGSLYAMIAADPSLPKPVGDWNLVRIICKGKHLETWLNGRKTADIEIGSSSWNALVNKSKFKDWHSFAIATSGPLGLQCHDDQVSYRNIRIREL
jgi:hypothetical protein